MSPPRKLTDEQVTAIRALLHVNVSRVARQYGVSRKTIQRILDGYTYKECDTLSRVAVPHRPCTRGVVD
jgi:DNA-binding phage protein